MQLLRNLLFPFSLLYALIVRLRNFFYDKGILSSKSFDIPVICIGNLSVGGTGKTPMTEFLIQLLRPHYKLAVLSRGYKRKSSGFVMADINSTVQELGDEPFQMYQKFQDITLAVDADRKEGIQILTDTVKPELIVLDDAYQHRKVKPAFSLLLTSYDELFVDDWYLPTGNLRDSKSAAKRANLIVVTKCSPNLTLEEQAKITKKLSPRSNQKVLFSYLQYDNHVYSDSNHLEVDTLKGKALTLVTGIANPAPLVRHLKSLGLTFEHLEFKDHHFFTDREINVLGKKELIITTEKDYVRLGAKISNLYYLPVRHRFINDGKEVLLESIKGIMK